MPKDTTWKYDHWIASILLPDGNRMMVSRKTEWGKTTFQAITTAIIDTDLNRLIDRVRVAWNEPDDSPSYDAQYQAQYAYACGYYD